MLGVAVLILKHHSYIVVCQVISLHFVTLFLVILRFLIGLFDVQLHVLSHAAVSPIAEVMISRGGGL